MKTATLLGICFVLLLNLTASAQQRFRLTFQAVCRVNDSSGRVTTARLSSRDLIQRCAAGAGITNSRSLELVYNLGAFFNGDSIEVVNTNGNLICQPFRLLFGSGVTNSDGTLIERLAFVYNDQQSDPVGSATITERTTAGRGGSTRFVLQGKIQFLDLARPNGLGVCNGTFATRTAISGP